MLGWCLVQEPLLVVFVHSDDEVEALEVLIADPARMDTTQCNSTTLGGGNGPSIRRFSDVIRVRPRGIDIDPIGKARFLDVMPENAFGGRGSANVAHADE
jgi:hypothetical protein